MPVIWAPPRDQFWKGLLVKYDTGMVMRRSSQVRTARKVSVISSTTPHSPSTTTVSPMPHHVAEGDLEPGEEVAEGGLRGDAGDDAQDARGGQQGGARRAHRGEGEQHRRDRHHGDDRADHPLDQRDLRAHPADPGRRRVCERRVTGVRGLHHGRRDPHHQPGARADQDQREQLAEARAWSCTGRQMICVVGPAQDRGEQDDAQRYAAAAQQAPQRGLAVPGVGSRSSRSASHPISSVSTTEPPMTINGRSTFSMPSTVTGTMAP